MTRRRDRQAISVLVLKDPKGGLALAEVQGALKDRAAPAPTHWADIPTLTYVPAERLKALDADGVDMEAFFPNIAGPTGTAFQNVSTPEFRLAAIKAYNDAQVEDWLHLSPRFIPQCIVPLWDVEAAVAELDHSAKLGHRGMIFSPNPDTIGFPHLFDRSWDPVWAAIQEWNLVLSFHTLGCPRIDPHLGFSER